MKQLNNYKKSKIFERRGNIYQRYRVVWYEKKSSSRTVKGVKNYEQALELCSKLENDDSISEYPNSSKDALYTLQNKDIPSFCYNVRIGTAGNQGYDVIFPCLDPFGKKYKKRIRFSKLKAAIATAKEKESEIEKNGLTVCIKLTAEESMKIYQFQQNRKTDSITLGEILDSGLKELSTENITYDELLDSYLKELRVNKIGDFEERKRTIGGISEGHFRNLKNQITIIRNAFGKRNFYSVSNQEIHDFIYEKNGFRLRNSRNWTTRRQKEYVNIFDNLKKLFNNKGFKKISLVKSRKEQAREKAGAYSVEVIKLILNGLLEQESPFLPAVVMIVFCGVRNFEATRIEWSQIDEALSNDSHSFFLASYNAKTKKPREIFLSEQAISWLNLSKRKGTRLSWGSNNNQGEQNFSKALSRKIKSIIGKDLFRRNALRWTYGTSQVAVEKEIYAKVSKRMGNSPSVLANHYDDPTHYDDIKNLSSIIPQSLEEMEQE